MTPTQKRSRRRSQPSIQPRSDSGSPRKRTLISEPRKLPISLIHKPHAKDAKDAKDKKDFPFLSLQPSICRRHQKYQLRSRKTAGLKPHAKGAKDAKEFCSLCVLCGLCVRQS